MNAKVQAKQYSYNSVSLNVPVFISKENPPNCHSSVFISKQPPFPRPIREPMTSQLNCLMQAHRLLLAWQKI